MKAIQEDQLEVTLQNMHQAQPLTQIILRMVTRDIILPVVCMVTRDIILSVVRMVNHDIILPVVRMVTRDIILPVVQ